MCVSLSVYGYPCMFLVGLTHVGIESASHSNVLLQMIYINIEHPHLQHLHEVIIEKPKVSSSLLGGISHLGGDLLYELS